MGLLLQTTLGEGNLIMKVQRLLKFVLTNLMVVCCFFMGTVGIVTSAVSDVDSSESTPDENNSTGSNVDFVEYRFEDFCDGGTHQLTFQADYSGFLKNSPRYAQCFSGARAYSNWLALALKYVQHSGSAEGGYVFTASPNWGDNGYSGDDPGSTDWQKGYARYQQVANKFVRIVTSAQISDVVRVAFDTESFNAQNAILMSWTDSIADISNTVFTTGGSIMFYFIIAQGLIDIFYLFAPQLGFILARQSYSSQMGGGGSRRDDTNVISKITSSIPDFASGAAVDAVNQGSGKRGGEGAGGFSRFWSYVSNQWVFVVAICVTFVLWSTGLWPRLISFFGSLVASGLYQYI